MAAWRSAIAAATSAWGPNPVGYSLTEKGRCLVVSSRSLNLMIAAPSRTDASRNWSALFSISSRQARRSNQCEGIADLPHRCPGDLPSDRGYRVGVVGEVGGEQHRFL